MGGVTLGRVLTCMVLLISAGACAHGRAGEVEYTEDGARCWPDARELDELARAAEFELQHASGLSLGRFDTRLVAWSVGGDDERADGDLFIFWTHAHRLLPSEEGQEIWAVIGLGRGLGGPYRPRLIAPICVYPGPEYGKSEPVPLSRALIMSSSRALAESDVRRVRDFAVDYFRAQIVEHHWCSLARESLPR